MAVDSPSVGAALLKVGFPFPRQLTHMPGKLLLAGSSAGLRASGFASFPYRPLNGGPH